MTGTLAERLADHVCNLRFEDIPSAVVARTKTVVTHDLAIAAAGSQSDESRHALTFARGAGGSLGQARVIGTDEAFAPLDAALVNAVMMRALRQEDTILPSFIHPGPILIPAALAIADQTRATGRELITALVAGYDALGALAGSDFSWNIGARTPSHVYGALGAAVVTAKLLDCNHRQMTKSIAYAGNLGAMITYGFDNHQYGLITRNGMTAAFLGEAGCPARADALEGPYGFFESQLSRMPDNVEQRIQRLGTDFEIMSTVLKPHPCTAINLVPIRLLEWMLSEHGIVRHDVERVVVARSRHIDLVPYLHSTGPWLSADEAISSLPFALATVLLDGSVSSERLNRPDDADITKCVDRVRLEFIDTPDLLDHTIELRMAGGGTAKAVANAEILRAPRPQDVLGTEGIAAIGARQAERLFRAVARLELLSAAGELTDCFVPDQQPSVAACIVDAPSASVFRATAE